MIPPDLSHYNALATARGLVTGGGKPLRFVLPDACQEGTVPNAEPHLGYEERTFHSGEVVTRPGNWHDAYNAEVWLEFPQAKAALNRQHVEALIEQRAASKSGRSQRGRVRDRLTQFDECGVILAGMPSFLWEALCAHRWRTVFIDHRETLLESTRFVVFGHASRDALRAPFIGLCGKAIRLDATEWPAIDEELAHRLAPGHLGASADFCQPWPALPLLGIPGMTPDNEYPAYYDDGRQFRPLPVPRAS